MYQFRYLVFAEYFWMQPNVIPRRDAESAVGSINSRPREIVSQLQTMQKYNSPQRKSRALQKQYKLLCQRKNWWERCQHGNRLCATTTGLSTHSLYCSSYHSQKLHDESECLLRWNFILDELISALLSYSSWFRHMLAKYQTGGSWYVK